MAKKKKPRKIPEVLLFSDPNHYPDALASLVVLSWLDDRGFIKLRGIVTEVGVYDTRRRRAQYAKGAMAHLGMPFLRVVPGGDYLPTDEYEENAFPETEDGLLMESMGTAVLRSGTTFIQEYVKSVPERNLYILLNAPFLDLAKYIKATGDALEKKLKKVVIMGNVLPQKDDSGNYLPDYNSYNFKVGAPAADCLFEYAQGRNIRMVMVSPQSVKDMNMGYEFLEGLEKSKNPVARELLAARGENPLSMQYDMLSALTLGDGEFKRSGGDFVQEEGSEKNVFFAKVTDPEIMRQKFADIFKEKLLPKKITLDQLRRVKPEEEKSNE